MTADAEIAGTVGYASGWLVLAVALLGAVVVWNVGVLVWGRPRRVRTRRTTSVDTVALRARYLALIDEVESAHARGDLDSREAHRRLSAASRGFVQEVTGQGTLAMTLADLRARRLSPLVEVVEIAYPPSFAPSSDRPGHALSVTLDRARAAVEATWS